jgi:hypothetical protein
MKENNVPARAPSPRPEPSGKSAREKLHELLTNIERQAEQIMRAEGLLVPALLVAAADKLFVYAPGPLRDGAEKNDFVEVSQLITTAHQAEAAVVVAESWMVKPKPGETLDPNTLPSQSPHRQECLWLIGETRGGLRQQRLLPILRDRHGRFSGLGPREVIQGPVQGRFSHLLLPGPVSRKARTVAVAMLAAKGLHVVGPLSRN